MSIQDHQLDIKKLKPSIEIISNLNFDDILNGRLNSEKDIMNKSIIFQTFFQENKSSIKSSILYGILICTGLFVILKKIVLINSEIYTTILMFSLGPLILFMLFAYNKIITGFIKFTMTPGNFLNGRGWGNVISGTISKNLTDLQIKILLKNIEKGVYIRRGGRNNTKRNIYFHEEVSNKVVFEESYGLINKGTSLESLLVGKMIHIDYLGENLFNSIGIDGKINYGLSTYLEVQIINGVYADIMKREIVYLDDIYFIKSQSANEGFNI